MKTKYQVIFFNAGREEWKQMTKTALTERLELLNIPLDQLKIVDIEIGDEIDEGESLRIFVLMLSQTETLTEGEMATLKKAVEQSQVVLPVYDKANSEGEVFGRQVPEVVSKFHAFAWENIDSSRELANIVLENLGLTEKDRKVFISYRRSDGTGFAEQLFDKLHRYGFRVFKDDYSIEHGREFQKSLLQNMDEIGYLVFVETEEAHNSPWILQELNYAVKKHYGVAVVRFEPQSKDATPKPKLTETTGEALGQTIFSVGQNELKQKKYPGNKLFPVFKGKALNRIKQFVIDTHAERMVARKKYFFDSIVEKCADIEKEFSIYKQWRIIVHSFLFQQPVMIGICPRTPRPNDLFQLEQDMLKARKDFPDLNLAYAILVHDAEHYEEQTIAINYWSLSGNLVDLMELEQLLAELKPDSV
jgi:hypothetical protein